MMPTRSSSLRLPPLIVIETEPPAPVQLIEHAHLLLQELELHTLPFIQPTRDREQQHTHWERQHDPESSVPERRFVVADSRV